MLLNIRPSLNLSIEYFVTVHDNDTTKTEFVSAAMMSYERQTWAAQSTSQIIVCRPRHRFFFFLFLSFFSRQCAGEWIWMCARSCIYPAASDRSIRQADGAARNAPLLFLVVSAVVDRIAHDGFSFHYVSASQLVSGTLATLCINERTTNVRRE